MPIIGLMGQKNKGRMKMIEIQNAPWIRDAEAFGMDDPEPVLCPNCHEECETLFVSSDGDVLGCENCVTTNDAFDWMELHGGN